MEMIKASELSFDAIIGQEKAKTLLRRAAANDRISHAYLFRGPAGVGKKRTALTLAAAVNCQAPVDGDSCGNCASCRKFLSGNHPDLMVLEPEGAFIKISQIRALKLALTYPPFEARYRVVLLPDIHNTMRRKETANSLLKTLEEPPANTILVLTGDESGVILPTILSRCQVIPFFSLPYDKVAAALRSDSDLEEETAATLAAIAEGSLGQARFLLDKDLLAQRRQVIDTLLATSPGDPQAVEAIFSLAETAAKLKEHLAELFDLLSAWLRDLMLLSGNVTRMLLNRDLADTFQPALARWQPDQLTERLALLDEARRQLRSNCTRTLVCEVLFFAML